MTISLDLVKQHLNYDDCDRDALIQQYTDAAIGWVEQYTGLMLARSVRSAPFTPSGAVSVPAAPDPVVQSVEYVDEDGATQTVDAMTYRVVGGVIYPVGSWPAMPYGGVMTVEAGFADGVAPASLVSAVLLLVGHWFTNREAVTVGVNASEVPFAVEALCLQHRQVWVV